MKYVAPVLVLMIVSLIFVVQVIDAQELGDGQDYKKYQTKRRYIPYFTIELDKKRLTVSAPADDSLPPLMIDREDLLVTESRVTVGDVVLFDSSGLHLGGRIFPLENVIDTRINEEDDFIRIAFLTPAVESNRIERIRRGNRISFEEDVTIGVNDFVRGLILCVTGDVVVDGEVNRDIVALFGNVVASTGAVIRGDIVSVTGGLNVPQEATVYGEMFSGKQGRRLGAHRFFRAAGGFEFDGELRYNRVDGAAPLVSVGFEKPFSGFPSVRLQGGYAFESKRGRYEVSLSQPILRGRRPVTATATYFKSLLSDDDRLLTNHENIVFTLLATEDYKDYYEAHGGEVAVEWEPNRRMTTRLSYRYEDTRWLDAQPHLWSLFGGGKLFADNYRTYSPQERDLLVTLLNSTENAFVTTAFDFDGRSPYSPYERSAWHIGGWLEWSQSGFGSDFDYRRYELSVRRYQKVARNLVLLLRGMHGNSDGLVPQYRRFFLGGIGTLPGYRHKEFVGTRYHLMTAELRLALPDANIAFGARYDLAQTADDTRLDDGIEWKQDIGLWIQIAEDLSIDLTKRLDRSENNDPRVTVRFQHRF